MQSGKSGTNRPVLLRWWRQLTLPSRVWTWFRKDFLGIFRGFRWSYLPPLMVYFAAGVSGFTGIVESFFVKKELELAAAFLAGLGFWAGLPWALKMPAGHLVDLFWEKKSWFVYVGACVMAASLLIMVGLTGDAERMGSFLNALMDLPFIAMFYGLHEWTQEHFGFGARTIALIDTMADSPMGQVAMIPMLAWIAREAPREQKATYFAVLAAFTNLALSASNLATGAVNEIFLIERGDYHEVGMLLIAVALANLLLPVLTVLLVRLWQRRGDTTPSS